MNDPTHTQTVPSTAPHPQLILQHCGTSVLLFSLVLTSTLFVSRLAILPTLTAVEVGGTVRDAAELASYAAELRTNMDTLERDRNAAVLPLDGTVYRALTDRKIDTPTVADLLEEFRELTASVVPEIPGAVLLSGALDNVDERTITIIGDVRGVGPRSMTILAQIVEALRNDERVQAVVPPRFIREEDPAIGFHSPFRITLMLR
jgi:hypothetical protein